MAQQSDKPHTTDTIADLANEKATLAAFALIGTFGNATSPAALVRTRDKTIHRVLTGDTLAGYVVVAIGSDNVTLTKGKRSRVLRMPAT